MIKIFYRSFIIVILIVFSAFLYLSTVGISTNIFNEKISKQIKKIDSNIEIDLDKIYIILNPLQFKLSLKTIGAKLIYNNEKIQFENIRSDISLKSLLNKEFSLKKIKVSTKSLEINNLMRFLSFIKNDPKFYVAEKLIKKGFLIADFEIEFDNNGNIKDNYKANGVVKDGKINFFKKYELDKINFVFNLKKNNFQIKDLDLEIENENILLPEIAIINKDNQFYVSGKLVNNQINLKKYKLNNFINLKNLDLNIKKINFLSENDFNFSFNKKFKIKDLNIISKVNLINLEIDNKFNLKRFFPEIGNSFYLKNNLLKLNYSKNKLNLLGSGNLLIQKGTDKIYYEIIKDKKKLNFNVKLNLKDNKFNLNLLNFEKKNKSNLEIKIKGENKINQTILFKEINLTEDGNIILIKDLNLYKNNKIKYINKIILNYKDRNEFKNDIKIIKKNKNYFIKGNSFNINKIVDNLINSKNTNNNNLISSNFKLKIDIKKIYLDQKNILQNLIGYLVFENNKVIEAELSSYFSDKKSVKFTIKTNGNERISTLFSNKAKPFVDRYKFIKGFDEGSLDFYSIKNKNKSNSTLKIYDFKLKELPALTKLLTLASLQGIADLLSGEGIRFNEFEMNFSNKEELMTIDEIYAIGPAISILMSGYIEKNNLVSLRGTLVPATTLNKTIGSIPFLGDILVGKKTGEGVFGVSFKIKGPPKDLETTVNPIKTLTPRFITRTLEKIKNN